MILPRILAGFYFNPDKKEKPPKNNGLRSEISGDEHESLRMQLSPRRWW
jgi:hypothetical protein